MPDTRLHEVHARAAIASRTREHSMAKPVSSVPLSSTLAFPVDADAGSASSMRTSGGRERGRVDFDCDAIAPDVVVNSKRADAAASAQLVLDDVYRLTPQTVTSYADLERVHRELQRRFRDDCLSDQRFTMSPEARHHDD